MESIAHNIEEKERTDDIKLSEKIPFRKMMLSERVRQGLSQAGFVYPTILQSNAIPLGKAGIDLLIQSKSGTGKTLIFCTIILDAYDCSIRAPQSLILVPTREVAVQIESVLNQIGKYLPDFNAVSVIGGTDVQVDRKKLQSAKAIVGTPGRVVHLIKALILNTQHIKVLVIDEADKFVDAASLRHDLEAINAAILANKKQTIASSATLSMELDVKLAKYMNNPLFLSTKKRTAMLIGIKQFVHEISEEKTSIAEMTAKLSVLKGIFSKVSFKQCIAFVNSQSRAESYSNFLEKDGWPCEFISAAQDQGTRLNKFQRFREFKTRILISTDLLSRGVDSENMNLVINLDLPDDAATYLHRIGRAGRFGSHGLAISFIASNRDRTKFRNIMNSIGQRMIVFKYPEIQCNLWNFSNLELEEDTFGVFELSDSGTDKENSSADAKLLKAISKQEKDCSNKTKVSKRPLSESLNAKFTFTVSGLSQKVPSSSAITLDDASSITVDTDIVDSKQAEVGETNAQLFSDNKTFDVITADIQPHIKVTPLDLVIDSESRSSLIKGDLFEDYKKAATPTFAESVVKGSIPNTSEYVHIANEKEEHCTKAESTFNKNPTTKLTNVSQEISKLKYLVLDHSDEDNEENDYEKEVVVSNQASTSSHMPGPSSSSEREHTTSHARDSTDSNRNNTKSIQHHRAPSNSVYENNDKSAHKLPMKIVQAATSGDSDQPDYSESDAAPPESTPSSGFGEKTPTEASSGIVTSTEYSESASDSDTDSYLSTSTSSYDSYAESEKESGEGYASYQYYEDGGEQDGHIAGAHNSRYKVANDRWTNIYWQQISQIQDYINISKNMREKTSQYPSQF